MPRSGCIGSKHGWAWMRTGFAGLSTSLATASGPPQIRDRVPSRSRGEPTWVSRRL
jgi:hypothetical protein